MMDKTLAVSSQQLPSALSLPVAFSVKFNGRSSSSRSLALAVSTSRVRPLRCSASTFPSFGNHCLFKSLTFIIYSSFWLFLCTLWMLRKLEDKGGA
uniref:Uncharacterized protein n=1 Tax=Rhizophora mucronata TaxID=61149 RepID=A0A2P2KK40_RHIMU